MAGGKIFCSGNFWSIELDREKIKIIRRPEIMTAEKII
jgi:hypothetical protein